MGAARKLERQPELRLYDPDGRLDRSYEYWLDKTNDPGAAATLVLAEVQSTKRPVVAAHNSDALNPPQIAKELRVSPDTVLGWIRTKQLKAANIATGNRPRWIIQRSDLDTFLQSRQPQPAAPRRKRRERPDNFKRYRD